MTWSLFALSTNDPRDRPYQDWPSQYMSLTCHCHQMPQRVST